MSARTGSGRRVVALAGAVVLIGGGLTGLGALHGNPVAVVSSAVAVLAGLVFLRRAAHRRS